MEENHPLQPGKASCSFSGREEKKPQEPSRHLSMNNIKTDENISHHHVNLQPVIEENPKEEETANEEEEGEQKEEGHVNDKKPDENEDLITISQQIDQFLSTITDKIDDAGDPLPKVPDAAIDRLAVFIEKEVTRLANNIDVDPDGGLFLFDAINRISKLTTALGAFPSEQTYGHAMAHAAAILQRTMSFLEEEFRTLLEENNRKSKDCKSDPPSSKEESDPTATSPETAQGAGSDTGEVERLRRIAGTMISAGYETECCQVFSITRKAALGSVLAELGFEKIGIEEMQKMGWEVLEQEIVTWITAFRQAVSLSFANERRLCEAVFSGHPAVSAGLFSNLARGVIIQLLNFAEGVTMTRRSGEKLFKFLDMYETMRDLVPVIDDLFPAEGEQQEEKDVSLPSSLLQAELKSEMSVAKDRIGEAVVGIFSDLENSIKCDNGKIPVPGGAVHPLTRYIMNYLKYACEYKNTLEQVFQKHHKSKNRSSDVNDKNGNNNNDNGGVHHTSQFAMQLMTIMDLLDENLDTKSKLYKDPSLSYIFLMNNGRYIVQKLKGWSEINELLGITWCRKRSSDLRQYHKNYQRETWGKLLNCFRDEGLHVKGGSSVLKPVLKERFKSFNAIFEEIHKTQSCWVVSDEQLQSELRVSVSAVVIPAYRSFLGRFRHYLDSGRHSDKYIKFAPEDLESYIDELFDGNSSSVIKRRT